MKFRNLAVDPVEFACLKAIILFKSGQFNIDAMFGYRNM
jgi:hypothetical protein